MSHTILYRDVRLRIVRISLGVIVRGAVAKEIVIVVVKAILLDGIQRRASLAIVSRSGMAIGLVAGQGWVVARVGHGRDKWRRLRCVALLARRRNTGVPGRVGACQGEGEGRGKQMPHVMMVQQRTAEDWNAAAAPLQSSQRRQQQAVYWALYQMRQ